MSLVSTCLHAATFLSYPATYKVINSTMETNCTFAVSTNCTAATRVLPELTSICRMISAIVPRMYSWKSLYNKFADESTTNTTSASLRHAHNDSSVVRPAISPKRKRNKISITTKSAVWCMHMPHTMHSLFVSRLQSQHLRRYNKNRDR